MWYGAFDEDSEKSNHTFTLTLYPFCAYRDHHSATQGSSDWHFLVENEGNRCCVRAYEGAATLTMIAGPAATFTPADVWYWNVQHRRERAWAARPRGCLPAWLFSHAHCTWHAYDPGTQC